MIPFIAFVVLIMIGMSFLFVASDNILDEGDENFYNDGVNYNK
jgi:hypothetical protein